MQSRSNSIISNTSTLISISENIHNNYINTNLVKKICILLEGLIDSNKLRISTKKDIINNSSFELKRIPFISLYDYLCRIIKYIKINLI